MDPKPFNAPFLSRMEAGDGTEGFKLRPHPLVLHLIIQVLDVEVDALVLAKLLHLRLLIRLAKLFLALRLLLRTSNKNLLAFDLSIIVTFCSSLSSLMVLKVDETKALALALLVYLDSGTRDNSILAEQVHELFLSHLSVDVLDIEVREVRLCLVHLHLVLLRTHTIKLSNETF